MVPRCLTLFYGAHAKWLFAAGSTSAQLFRGFFGGRLPTWQWSLYLGFDTEKRDGLAFFFLGDLLGGAAIFHIGFAADK